MQAFIENDHSRSAQSGQSGAPTKRSLAVRAPSSAARPAHPLPGARARGTPSNKALRLAPENRSR